MPDPIVATDDPRRPDVVALLERHLAFADYVPSRNSTFLTLRLEPGAGRRDPGTAPRP